MLARIHKRFWIALSTGVVIALVFAFYFLYYVKNKEADFVTNGYRILNRVANNIIEKKTYYENLSRYKSTPFYNIPKGQKVDTTELVSFLAKGDTLRYLNVKNFIQNLWRKDFFDDFFIVRNDRLSFNTTGNAFKIGGHDSLLTKGNGVHTPNVIDITISETKYKAFIYRIHYKENEDWVLGGLIEWRHYRNEIHQVEPYFVLLASLTLLSLILGMPLLKILLLSKIERLYTKDVIGASISLVLIVLLLTLISASWFYHGFHNQRKKVTENLDSLSNDVNDRFLNEIQLALKTTLANDKNIDSLIEVAEVKLVGNVSYRNIRNSPVVTNANYIFWIDGAGLVKLSRTPSNNELIGVDLREREYFKAITENYPLWSLDGHQFYFQSITSWVEQGEHEAVISTPGIYGYKVAAHASNLSSVMGTLLAPGYGYAIMDEKGDVWFHSQIEKNLQENFLEETGNDPSIKSAIYSRTKLSASVLYQSKTHEIFLRPIDGLPLFLVTFYDKEYLMEPLLQTVTITIMLTLFFLIFMGALLWIFVLVTRKKSKLRTAEFALEWLSPCRENGEIYPSLISIQGIGCGLIIAAYLIFENSPSDQGWILAGLCVVPILLFIICYRKLRGIHNHKTSSEGDSYIRGYKAFIILWLFVLAALPTYIIFSFAYQHEQIVMGKHELLHSYKQIVHREQKIDSLATTTVKKEWIDDFTKKMKDHGQYLKSLGIQRSSAHPRSRTTGSKDFFGGFTNWLHVSLTGLGILTSEVNSLTSESDSIEWSYNVKRDTIFLQSWLMHKNPIALAKGIRPPSTFLSYALAAAPVFIFFVFCFWLMLSFLVRNTHAYEFYEKHSSIQWKDLFLSTSSDNKKSIKFHHLFLVGLPFSGRKKIIEDIVVAVGIGNSMLPLNFAEHIETEIDFDKLKKQIDSSHLIVIEHFEFNSESHPSWKKKLKILEFTRIHAKCPMIILSESDIEEVYDFYHRLKEENARNKDADSKSLKMEYNEQLQRWKNVMGSFITMYVPLTRSVQSLPDYENVNVRKVIQEELAYGTYLKSIEPLVKPYYDLIIKSNTKEEILEDLMLLRIESLASPYYQNIWNACSKEEKFLIYDLAHDQFINLKNSEVVKNLLQKSIFRFDNCGVLRLINRSFNNFVMKAVKEDEEVLMENVVEKESTWSSLKVVLVLTALGLMIFLAVGQQSIVSSLDTTLAALGAIATLFLKFGGFFDSKSKKGE